ncbi:MAG: flagellar basal body P-ring formation protein FlgA, partial [Magnetococcales bacterium]|nr:flagellar basal body P-ring formation protein FlgA [Magnetococcales bacterium]
RNQSVGADDLEWQTVEVDKPLRGTILDPKEVVGLTASRQVREGIPLGESWFERPLAVERGSLVRVLLEKGGLVITSSATSVGKGRVGDLVEVRNPRSQRRFMARVVAPGEVRVEN